MKRLKGKIDMNIKLKLPYNFYYSEELIEYLEDYADLIDSIYFSFTKGSRPLKNLQDSRYFHIKKLEKIKERLNVKLNYVLNSVIHIEVTELDQFIFESNLVDIVTLARDDVYESVSEYIEKKNLRMCYEASRFYRHIDNNQGTLLNNANILTYGFEYELPHDKKNDQLLCFIANERCYDKCEFKIKHNTNVLLRNLGETIEKFSCPYKDKREIYSKEKVMNICEEYNVDLIKFCDRTMTDHELLHIFKDWFPYIKTVFNQPKSNSGGSNLIKV